MFEGPFMRYIKQSPFIGDRWSGIIFLEVYVLGKTTRSIPTPRFQEAPDRGLIDSESLTPGSQSLSPGSVHIVSGLFCCVTHVSYWTCMWFDMLSYEQCFILDMHVAWHVLSWGNLTVILFIDCYWCNTIYVQRIIQYWYKWWLCTELSSFHSMLNGRTQLAPTQP